MGKGIIILLGLFTVILFISISFVFAISTTNQKLISQCKKDCVNNEKTSKDSCNFNYTACLIGCSNNKECSYECNLEKNNCIGRVVFIFANCAKNCNFMFSNITCGNHSLGEIFNQNCSICRCEINSKVTCKKTDFCNYNKVLRNQDQCVSNNGLYQPLCNGPYFDIVCSKDNFCLCDGEGNYTCPENYTCLHDFSLSLTRRGYTIAGWKTLLGVQLGNIGICVKKPLLESCGNGVCENKLMEGKEAETRLNCPIDCN